MARQKFGKKDIFAPAVNAEKKETKKTEQVLEKPAHRKRPKKKKKVAKKHMSSESTRLTIHSFRMREDLVEKLREYAFFEKTKIYKVINQAVEEFLKNYKPKMHSRT